MAISSVVSRFQASAASMRVLEPGELGGGLVGVVGRQLVEAVEHVAQLAHAVLDVAAHVLVGSSCGSCSSSPTVAPGASCASPRNSVSRPAMIRSSVDLPDPLGPSTPILAPGRKRQRDVLQHPLVGRVDPGQLVHREDVLRRHERSRIESGRGTGGLRRGLLARGPSALSAEGPDLSRRLRAHAARVALRLRPALVRARDRAEPHRRGRRPGDGRTPARSRRSPTPTSRPRSASSTSRSTCRRGCSRAACSPSSRRRCAAASTAPRSARARVGAHMMIIGILPTVGEQHLTAEAFSDSPRYSHAQRADLRRARARTSRSRSTGVERLPTFADTIAPEAACTSVQLHQQVDPEGFASHWNAAQAIAGAAGGGGARTRRSSSAGSYGARRASRCSSRPPTRVPRS